MSDTPRPHRVPSLFDRQPPVAGADVDRGTDIGRPSTETDAARNSPAEPPPGPPAAARDARSLRTATASAASGRAPANPPGEAGHSGLPTHVRRALVQLLKHGVILADNRRDAFDALVTHRAAIDSHLANQFLSVLLDEVRGVAVLQQIEDDGDETNDEPAASLLNRRPLTLYHTLVVLVLRRHFQEREAAGEQRVIIDIDRIESALRPFLKLTQSSSLDRKHLNGALTRMQEHRLLSAQRGDDERYEISPVIRYVVSAEVLETLLAQYSALAADKSIATTPP